MTSKNRVGRSCDRLREDLQQVAFVVAVRENAQFRELVNRLLDLPDGAIEIVVIGRGARRNSTPSRAARRTV